MSRKEVCGQPTALVGIHKSYTLLIGSLEDRMKDFIPLVIVDRDGAEVSIPVAEFLKTQKGEKTDGTQA